MFMKRDDPIFDLLHKADSSAPPAPRIDDLPRAVFRRHRRRRAVRAASLITCLVLLACSGVFLVQRTQTRQLVIATQPSPIDTRAIELAAIDANIERHVRTADLLVAGEKRRQSRDRTQRSLEREDAIDMIQDQRNRAGLTLVSQGDRLNQQLQRSDDAVEVYRRAVELFPNTPAATIAAERLDRMKT